MITNDPIGGYKHPDHIAIHKATTKAFHLAGDPAFVDPDGLPPYQPQKLYYQTYSQRALRLAVKLLPLLGRDPRHFGRNGDIDIQALVEEGDFPIHARIDYRPVVEKREAAAACHASQLDGGPPRRGLLGWSGACSVMWSNTCVPTRRRSRGYARRIYSLGLIVDDEKGLSKKKGSPFSI